MEEYYITYNDYFGFLRCRKNQRKRENRIYRINRGL